MFWKPEKKGKSSIQSYPHLIFYSLCAITQSLAACSFSPLSYQYNIYLFIHTWKDIQRELLSSNGCFDWRGAKKAAPTWHLLLKILMNLFCSFSSSDSSPNTRAPFILEKQRKVRGYSAQPAGGFLIKTETFNCSAFRGNCKMFRLEDLLICLLYFISTSIDFKAVKGD